MKKRSLDLNTLQVESFHTGSAAEEVVAPGFDSFRNCPTAYGCPPTPLG